MTVSQLVPVSVNAPGYNGLNVQDSPVAMPPEFALAALNAVIDQSGRIGARKGWEALNDGLNIDLGTDNVTCVHEYIKKDGTTQILCVGPTDIYTLSGSTLTTVYTDATWTAANWKAVNFNGYAYFFQRGHDPLRWDGTTLIKMSAAGSYLGTVPLANEVLSAYGRLWVVDTSTDKVTITWSDTLIGEAWTGGASGSLDISSVLANEGIRPVTALAAFNGYLVIFCDKAIIIYSGADSAPASSLTLVEVVNGVGAVGRDCVQPVGNDIFFVSDTGVRSLGRIINEKSPPLFDVSRNVRDKFNASLKANGDNAAIKTVYNDFDGFFLVTFNNLTSNSTYCFDTKQPLQDNSRKASIWNLNPLCYRVTSDRQMLMGFKAYVGTYNNYTDNGNTYRFKYATAWLDGGDPTRYKILKNLLATLIGVGNVDILFRWAVDYSSVTSRASRTLADYGSSEFSIAEYAIGEYSGLGYRAWKVNIPLSKYGRVFQISIEFNVSGPMSVQQLDAFVKPGRISLQ